MAQHFLLSKKYRDISEYELSRFTENDWFDYFRNIRFGGLDKSICPRCGAIDAHYFFKAQKRWRCKHCHRYFSIKSGTVWADSKLSLSKIAFIVEKFCSAANGISALRVSANANVQYKTAWVALHKLRESIIRTNQLSKLKGEVHVDGGHFGGKPRSGQFRHKAKPEEIAAKIKLGKSQGARRSRGTRANYERKKKNRRIVMVAREVVPGVGGTKTAVFLSSTENDKAAKYIADNFIEPGSLVRTDENSAYSSYSARFTHETVEHSKEYSTIDGVNNNQAESYFSRLRRCEYGVTHQMQARYMWDYANEMAWREDSRWKTAKEKFDDLLFRTLSTGLTRWWRGYWQGYRRRDEMLIA